MIDIVTEAPEDAVESGKGKVECEVEVEPECTHVKKSPQHMTAGLLTSTAPQPQRTPQRIVGVLLANGTSLPGDAVVLAVGHSGRTMYETLLSKGVHLEPKPIAVGFRVEHPQDVINRIQLGAFAEQCGRGEGRVPVADYKLATQVEVEEDLQCSSDYYKQVLTVLA